MNNEFLKQTLKALEHTDMAIHFPEIREVIIEKDKREIHIALIASSGGFRLKDNILLQIMVFFTLLDAYVDLHSPHLEGKGFATKYKSLPIADDLNIMTKEIYRLLRILRNASIHSRTAITHNNTKIEAVSSDSRLELEIKGLDLIYTFVLLLLEGDHTIAAYKTALLRTYYDDIGQALISVQDTFGDRLTSVSAGPRLKRGVRYRLQNASFQMKESGRYITIKKEDIKGAEASWADYDYVFTISDVVFMIPNEILTEPSEILVADLSKWRYNPAYPPSN
ncbi:MAG: hypothetical protein HZB31_00015 [Nitrospirae bacterium]|nr:hypothetical protein [Nitrospirota bacterium]